MGKEIYDNLLLEILANEREIMPFLDVIFSFLYRRTDFYKLQKKQDDKMGFPPGVAEVLVRTAFTKYLTIATKDEERMQQQAASQGDAEIVPETVTEEVVVETTDESKVETSGISGGETSTKCQLSRPKVSKPTPSESFNGASRDKYSWSQTIQDLDIRVKVPETVTSGKHVQVTIEPLHLSVSILDSSQWSTIIHDNLPWKISVQDSLWSLVPGEHIHINLEKIQERWWDSLLVNEPKINIESIDTTLNYTDLDAESRACIGQLMYDEQQKLLGKPTSQQQKVQNLLKEAWNKEGSPFLGQEFNPAAVTVVNADQFPN